ncbi:hypothetical protein HPP92_013547 [Vanilla planifolia]|uniref:SHSP domain-containing protein n=1 Tax=Vanilla planifolia TaxID=51239 RepID=A0A835QNN8_VANPL|nr:hypothetical protein HPP92_013547 [Vanilla planifolia]
MSSALFINPINISNASAFPRHRQLSIGPIHAAKSDSLDHLQITSKQQSPAPGQTVRRRAPLSRPWDRFPTARTVQQMIDTMERIMEDPFTSEREAAAAGGLNGYRRGGRTPWEIREVDGVYKMRFDIPGMTKTDARVWVEDGMLVIKAEKQQSSTEDEKEEEWPATSFGRYGSRIALPESVVVEEIRAEVRDGVLYVTVPKAEPKSNVVDVNVQ